MTTLLLSHGSYLLIVAILVLTGAGLPIPEEVPVLTAGVMAAHGQLDVWMAFGACLVGALLGDSLMYLIGYSFGRGVLREHRYWACFVKPEQEVRMEQMISRHGLKVLFLARFLVGLRLPIYLAAGILRLRFRRFFLIDLFCASSVIGVFFLLSYHYGQTITGWIRHAEIAASLVAVLALAVAGLFYWRWHRRRLADPAIPLHASDPLSAAECSERGFLEVEKVA
ncbi:MAG: DedA family protein [Pirellulales bacterium]|nr:DedA family protein [Pirellulales bacterium]